MNLLDARVERWRAYLRANPGSRATVDFEGRSECDLTKRGSWNYSRDETTEVMCLAYRLPGQERELWHRAHEQHLIGETPPPEDLFAYILAGGLVEAHNAFFERMLWQHIMVPRYGWPPVDHLQWRCSAGRCEIPSFFLLFNM